MTISSEAGDCGAGHNPDNNVEYDGLGHNSHDTLYRVPFGAVTAGTEVIRQGDVGDRLYVVDAGSFEIVRDGSRIATAGEGEHFGEIALLHDVPRTATVRALTDGAVWALDQEEFLATVTGVPQAASAAHAVSAERLRVRPGDPGASGGPDDQPGSTDAPT